MPSQHSNVVGGSTAGLVLKCNASIEMKKKVPPEPFSIYAAEGTALHTIAEEAFLEGLSDDEILDQYTGREMEQIKITRDAIINKIFPALDIVDDILGDEDEGDDVYVESKVTFKGVIDGAWGTGDLVFNKPKAKRHGIIDYKFGDGRIVHPVDNDQMRFYLAAAINDGLLPRNHNIVYEAHIIQPAAKLEPSEYHKVAEYSLKDLTEFTYNLKDAVESPTQAVYGSHCKDCRGRLACTTFKNGLSGVQETEVEGMTNKQVAYWLSLESSYKRFFEDLRALARDSMIKGVRIKGYGIEPALGNQKWINKDAAHLAAQRMGMVKKDRLKEPEIISPTQMIKKLKAMGVPKLQIERFQTRHVTRDDNGFRLVKSEAPNLSEHFGALQEHVQMQLAAKNDKG